MTYYDRLNQFFQHIVYNEIPPHAQLVYLHLLNHNNQLGWQEKFCITDRRLELLTGLSKQAITDAKRILKDRFVTINTDKKKPRQGSCYSLLNFLHSIESKKESKTEGKTESKNDGKPKLTHSISVSKIKERDEDTNGAGARVCGSEPSYGDLDGAIVRAWKGDNNAPLSWDMAYSLSAFEETHGADAVVKAIIAAKTTLKGKNPSIPYLRGTLLKMKERRERDGKVNRNEGARRQESRRPSTNYNAAFGFDDDD